MLPQIEQLPPFLWAGRSWVLLLLCNAAAACSLKPSFPHARRTLCYAVGELMVYLEQVKDLVITQARVRYVTLLAPYNVNKHWPDIVLLLNV